MVRFLLSSWLSYVSTFSLLTFPIFFLSSSFPLHPARKCGALQGGKHLAMIYWPATVVELARATAQRQASSSQQADHAAMGNWVSRAPWELHLPLNRLQGRSSSTLTAPQEELVVTPEEYTPMCQGGGHQVGTAPQNLEQVGQADLHWVCTTLSSLKCCRTQLGGSPCLQKVAAVKSRKGENYPALHWGREC